MAKFIKHHKLAYALVFPQIVITLLFFIWPAVNAIVQSFLFADAFGLKSSWAGLINFRDLFCDISFIKSLVVTGIIALAITCLTLTLGLFLAVLVNARQKSGFFYKTLLLWPYAVAPAVAAILWRFLFQSPNGWITYSLSLIGINFNYLISPIQALIVVVITASWQQFSYNFLFFLAALKAIPQPILDAARMDSSGWSRFWLIIFPLISPTTFFLMIMNLIYSFFDTFGIIDILTHGGPSNSTATVIYKIYKDGFINMDLGSAAAQSVVLMLLLIGLTALQFLYIEKRVHY